MIQKNSFSIISANVDASQAYVDIRFYDSPELSWRFHSQWLYDASCEHGFSKSFADSAFMSSSQLVQSISIISNNVLRINWSNQTVSNYPAIWLHALAEDAALPDALNRDLPSPRKNVKYWHLNSLSIPELEWSSLMDTENNVEYFKEKLIDLLIKDSENGIVKIINCPSPNVNSERNMKDTLITKLLCSIFGSVYYHLRRGADKTFNISSEDTKKAEYLHNFDTKTVLLPHTDHSFITNPAMVMGIYGLEGASINTWVDGFAALKILNEEDPDSYTILSQTPLRYGRIAHFYTPHLMQSITDTTITFDAEIPDRVKRIRWHPHLVGPLKFFHNYQNIRMAVQKFQSIMLRPEIKMELPLEAGDLYLWNNFRLLHGRQCILQTPRTSIGQTVTEDAVMSKARELKINRITSLSNNWLAQLPYSLVEKIINTEDSNKENMR